MNLLSRKEELVLLSIWKLGPNAYGNAVRRDVSDATGYNWLIGSVYAPISKMLREGLVISYNTDPEPVKGGRSKVVYRVTEVGKSALNRIKEVNKFLWNDIPPLEF